MARVQGASSVISGADARIGSDEYFFIKSPLTGVAEERTFMMMRLTAYSESNLDLQPAYHCVDFYYWHSATRHAMRVSTT